MSNPLRESLVATVQEAMQDPCRLRELEGKVDHHTAENHKTTEQLRKLEAERHENLKHVKETTIMVQKVSDVVGISGDVWWKAKMFDAELKNAGHVSGTKMVTFVMDQGSRIDAALKAMKAPIASCTELFPVMVESSKDGETSSSYSDLTPQDVVKNSGTRGRRWKPTNGKRGPSGRYYSAHYPACFRDGGSGFHYHPGFLHGREGNHGWLPRGRGNTTEPSPDLPCGC